MFQDLVHILINPGPYHLIIHCRSLVSEVDNDELCERLLEATQHFSDIEYQRLYPKIKATNSGNFYNFSHPITPLSHASHTSLTPLSHPSHTPFTPLSHPFHTSTPLLHQHTPLTPLSHTPLITLQLATYTSPFSPELNTIPPYQLPSCYPFPQPFIL